MDVVVVGNDALAVRGALCRLALCVTYRDVRTSFEHFAAAVASLSIGRVRAGIFDQFQSL